MSLPLMLLVLNEQKSIEYTNIYLEERNTKKARNCGLQVCSIQFRINSEGLVLNQLFLSGGP